jgi:hypothetical protein
MGEFGNGVAVAVEALQDDLDFVEVFWCAALEAARLDGVVDAVCVAMAAKPKVVPRRMPWVATSSTRFSTATRRSAGVSPRAFTCSANCSTSIFSWLSSASRAAKLQSNGD